MARTTSSDVAMAILNDETLKDRFQRYYDTAVGEHACWEWRGAKKNTPGQHYGITTTKRVYNKPGKMVCTSRLALFYKTYLWPVDRIACHTCDNPSCVNPNHLYWGTDQDNAEDMTFRGRHYQQIITAQEGREPTRPGVSSRKPNRRLYKNENEKVEIKRAVLAANKEGVRNLSITYGMSFGMLIAIKYGSTWKDVKID